MSFLEKRGFSQDHQLHRYLFPRLSDLPHPEKMGNLVAAADVVVRYIVAQKEILIWGDYDVDGTTGTALLVNFFREFGVKVSWHIPGRLTEGYGLNKAWFLEQKNLPKQRDFLLITVDCGISNVEEISLVKALGAEVIVTDHHVPPENGLPDCLILNPALPTCGFHGQHLAGVGVAFYLAAAIRTRLATIFPNKVIHLKDFLAFVALGTIADVVELSPTNRILVRGGMEALQSSPFPGVRELLAGSGLGEGEILSEDISYTLGPKINAAGRLGDSQLAVALLTAEDAASAQKLAKRLTLLNEQRKSVTTEILEKTIATLSQAQVDQEKSIIVDDISHQGVAGIIASKLVEVFNVPVVVFGRKLTEKNTIQYVGSARSPEHIDILQLLRSCAPFWERCGGHRKAAGLVVNERQFPNFSKMFSLAAQKVSAKKIKSTPEVDIECSIESMLSSSHILFFKMLEPFGPGNEAPIFRDRQSCIIDAKTVGRDMEHLQVSIRGKLNNFKGIGFGLGGKIDDIQRVPIRPIRYCPTLNRFRGSASWQIRIIDI